jgi:hypothetical protein
VGETHGKMKVEQAALNGLNINTLKIHPFQGCVLISSLSHRFSPVVIQILSLQDN